LVQTNNLKKLIYNAGKPENLPLILTFFYKKSKKSKIKIIKNQKIIKKGQNQW
jgi:hypothetical protein